MSLTPLATRALARRSAGSQLSPAVRASAASAMQTRHESSYSSPFRSTAIPSFAKYRNNGGEMSTKTFQYFLAGTMGAVTAMGAKNVVQGTESKSRGAIKTNNRPFHVQ